MTVFYYTSRVYYGDTDCGGVVYYANYLRYMEAARTEFFAHHQLPLEDLESRYHVVAVIKKIEARYLAPARLGMKIKISCRPLYYRRATIVLSQDVFEVADGKKNTEDRQLFSGIAEMTCVDSTAFKPIPVPDLVKEILSSCGAEEKPRDYRPTS